MYYILRNNQQFGPYTPQTLKDYVEDGKILMNDKAFAQNQTQIITVRDALKHHHIKVHIKHNGGIFAQLQALGHDLIIPNISFVKNDLLKDRRLIYLYLIGLLPVFIINFTGSYLTYYLISLYFSIIWGGFFFYLFKTAQVQTKQAIILFFASQFLAFTLTQLQLLPPFNYLYSMTKSALLLPRMMGFVLGVGVLEETIKLLPLIYVIWRGREPIVPQTLVFYGLISGIGFGVLEGVLYQTTENKALDYDNAYFFNLARLTSLPFLHAIWAATAGYFLCFAQLYPKYRRALYLLALAIPATLHGLYDTFGWTLIGLFCTLLSVLLLIFYLKRSKDYQSKLVNIK